MNAQSSQRNSAKVAAKAAEPDRLKTDKKGKTDSSERKNAPALNEDSGAGASKKDGGHPIVSVGRAMKGPRRICATSLRMA